MEKNKQTPNHLTQTLNKSTMYEPVLSLKSSCVWHERAKAVSPKYKSQGLERGCWPGVGFWQERPSLKRSHVPWVSYSDQMIILELDYQDRLVKSWDRTLLTLLFFFFFFFKSVSLNLHIKYGQIVCGNINTKKLKAIAWKIRMRKKKNNEKRKQWKSQKQKVRRQGCWLCALHS